MAWSLCCLSALSSAIRWAVGYWAVGYWPVPQTWPYVWPAAV